MKLRCVLMLAAAAASAGGCSEWSTYPSVEVKAGTLLARPESRSVVSVMAASVQYAQANLVKDQDLAINLPQGTPAEAYEKLFAKLGGGRPMRDPNEPAIHLTEVRTRGMHAEADLIHARADGLNQLVTLRLERTLFETYRVTDAKPWQLRNVSVPPPHYVPPPPPKEPERKDGGAGNASQPNDRPDAAEPSSTQVPRDPLVPG